MTTKIKVENIGWTDIPKILSAYISMNKWPLGLLVVCVVFGMTNMFQYSRLPPWKNWEISSLGFTLIYTYGAGFKKKIFRDAMKGDRGLLFGLALAGLVLTFLLSGNEFFHLFTFGIDRRGTMLVLLATALLFVWLDFTFFKALTSSHSDMSKGFLLSLKFSDIPISIAFAILTIYAFWLGKDEIDRQHMDAFFGGTIAFQMMLSNIIWTLTDDVFLEHPYAKPLTSTEQ